MIHHDVYLIGITEQMKERRSKGCSYKKQTVYVLNE